MSYPFEKADQPSALIGAVVRIRDSRDRGFTIHLIAHQLTDTLFLARTCRIGGHRDVITLPMCSILDITQLTDIMFVDIFADGWEAYLDYEFSQDEDIVEGRVTDKPERTN
jgi:hypothetical protein